MWHIIDKYMFDILKMKFNIKYIIPCVALKYLSIDEIKKLFEIKYLPQTSNIYDIKILKMDEKNIKKYLVNNNDWNKFNEIFNMDNNDICKYLLKNNLNKFIEYFHENITIDIPELLLEDAIINLFKDTDYYYDIIKEKKYWRTEIFYGNTLISSCNYCFFSNYKFENNNLSDMEQYQCYNERINFSISIIDHKYAKLIFKKHTFNIKYKNFKLTFKINN